MLFSINDVYPFKSSILTTLENTIPEQEEQEVLLSPVTGDDSGNHRQVVTGKEVLKFAGVIGGIILILVLLGIAK